LFLTNFTASIIFPRFLALHRLFGSFLPRRIYHRTHVSRMRHDRFGRLVNQGYFTIFVLGVSDKSVPIRECCANAYIVPWFSLPLVVTARTTIDDILITLQNNGLFHPTDIGYALYTATSRFRQLTGTTTLGDLRAGPQTHFHLRYLLLGGVSMYLRMSIIYPVVILMHTLGRIISDSDGEIAASSGRPARSKVATIKITDPSNRSALALSSHRDAALAAQRAAAAALATAANADNGAESLSTMASTSNSRSVSPGKRNVSDAELSSKSWSESEGDLTLARGKGKGKGKHRGEMTNGVMNFCS